MSWLTEQDLQRFKKVGRGVKVSTGAVVYGAENIEIGDNVRIDHGAMLVASAPEAYIEIGSHVHIAAQAILSAAGGIRIGDFCAIGMGSKLVTATDSFSGEYLVGPQFDPEFIADTRFQIVICPYAVVTTDCTLLPGSYLRDGCVVGAKALVRGTLPPWRICVGIPAKPVKDRSSGAIERGRQWIELWNSRQA